MKGVILSGGTGSRLRPITHTGPKQLVPVANKPVLQYAIEDLKATGITDIGIVLGNKGCEAIQEYFGNGSEFGVDITYIVQGNPLGLAHAVGCARSFVGGQPFVTYLGDNLMRDGIGELVDDFDPETYAAGIGLQEVDDPSEFGVVEVDQDGDEIVRLVEKPDDPPSDFALIGIYVFTPAIFDQIERLEPSWRGEYEITEAMQGLLDDGYRIQSHLTTGWWKDTGRPDDIIHANRLVLDNIDRRIGGDVVDGSSVTERVELGAGSVVEEGAVIRGPVSIGQNTVIGPSAYVGPYTSIGDNCQIDIVSVESSVIIGDSEVTANRRIVDSLIGRETVISTDRGERPDGDRFVVGRNSKLDLQ